MAPSLAVTIAVIFLSVTLVNGRTPSNQPEAGNKGVPSNSILLPSQKPDSEKQTESKLPEIETETTESTTEAKHVATTRTTVPLAVITFHPINRHFIRGSLIPFRHGHRYSHHHNHHRQFKRWRPRFHGRKISYANNMITNSHPVTGGENHRIPARWSRFHREHHPKFSFMRATEKIEDMKKTHHAHHHRHHYHHHHDGDEKKFEHEHEHGMGILRKIRQFLTHF